MEDAKMRAEYRERERERAAAEEQRIAAFAREQAQREEERRAVQSAQNEYRERMQQEVTVCYTQWTIKNVTFYFWLWLWLILTDFYSFYIILIVKKFYMRL